MKPSRSVFLHVNALRKYLPTSSCYLTWNAIIVHTRVIWVQYVCVIAVRECGLPRDLFRAIDSTWAVREDIRNIWWRQIYSAVTGTIVCATVGFISCRRCNDFMLPLACSNFKCLTFGKYDLSFYGLLKNYRLNSKHCEQMSRLVVVYEYAIQLPLAS